MTSQTAYVLFWWFILFSLGIICLPLSSILFKKLFNQGYAFAKVLSILIGSYLSWYLARLKLIPFSESEIWITIIALTLFNLWLIKRKKIGLTKKRLKLIFLEESVFLVALCFWAKIRSFQPDILGLEKFMDFGFVNSILRSDFMPPADMWLTGETINYYYFGHFLTAWLTKLSKIDSAVTYNLMIATLFALTFSLGWSLSTKLAELALVKNNGRKISKNKLFAFLRPKYLFGLLASLLLTLGGNLHPLWWFWQNRSFESYWYPDATRFIVENFGAADNTIHEFPLYSFVVADLHGHLINLPNVILTIALIITINLKIINQSKLKDLILHLGLLSLSLSIAFMSNAWDYPIYLLLAGSTFLISLYHSEKNIKGVLLKNFYLCLIILGLSLFFILPFIADFANIAQGVKLADFHSPIWMLMVLWGFPLFLTVFFFLIFLLNHRKPDTPDLLIAAAVLLAWLLIIIPEIIYVKDIYIHTHQRANTMFKLTYQSFVIFSLTSSYLITRILLTQRNKILKITFLGLFLPFLFFIFFYPFKAVDSYYGLENEQGLSGLGHLEKRYPDDYQAILWLRQTKGKPVVAEAVGDSYTDYGRISANTGLPTVLGWPVHEWLWRGSFDEPQKRTTDVQNLYETDSPDLAQEIIGRYRIEMVFIGNLEREKYPALKEEKFAKIGQPVFSSGSTKIFVVNPRPLKAN